MIDIYLLIIILICLARNRNTVKNILVSGSPSQDATKFHLPDGNGAVIKYAGLPPGIIHVIDGIFMDFPV